MAETEDMEEEEEEKWYERLAGGSPYEKLVSLRTRVAKELRISKRSKRWWVPELTEQLKTTRKARKDTNSGGHTGRENQEVESGAGKDANDGEGKEESMLAEVL
ncbi:hypothetical protein L211DRAFT_853022 [Terfezia boudieri ATCC MYA-4762]|uniref:Uncharacterized protein n=1 Tax=Terfezia boudieri ATCC MYA-4762 TaxID=1051890 RepID=A0A3N4L9Q9_9PEZI|nr:hypothetical protein L211DRAFT_853022 [Terfezia boudieri ATCC MYA-4762]